MWAFTSSTLNTGGFALIDCINFTSKSNCNQSTHFKRLELKVFFSHGLIIKYSVDDEGTKL